jgi:hypothetical protein
VVEHSIGNGEVDSSILSGSTTFSSAITDKLGKIAFPTAAIKQAADRRPSKPDAVQRVDEIAGPFFPRRALAAISASSKNCRRDCSLEAAGLSRARQRLTFL